MGFIIINNFITCKKKNLQKQNYVPIVPNAR